MTRWHEDDLAGRILAKEDDWKIVSLPAIREDTNNPDDPREIGSVLWPERHSAEKILQVKALSERTFISLYQQRPAPVEGGLFKRSWFKYYNTKTGTPPKFDTIIQSWDCTFKDALTSDFVVGTVWAKAGVETYLIDMVRGQWSFSETVKQMRLLSEKYPQCDQVYVEDKANGTAIIDTLKQEIAGIIPVSPTESKESRASAISYVIEAGNVYFPSDANWLQSFIEEIAVFPNGKHDDMVDSMTQALYKLYKGMSTPGLFII
jgi:predicted phage terminase large subunit-like protein